MPITPARQRNGVSEGIALGLLVCGRDTFAFDKIRLDLAFAGAWRGWQHRGQFRQVTTDLANGSDPVWVFTGADVRKNVWVLYWERVGGQVHIRARQTDWTASDPEDLDYAVGMIDGDVPLVGWEALAREFLRRFDRPE
jgi:hypothetical protein